MNPSLGTLDALAFVRGPHAVLFSLDRTFLVIVLPPSLSAARHFSRRLSYHRSLDDSYGPLDAMDVPLDAGPATDGVRILATRTVVVPPIPPRHFRSILLESAQSPSATQDPNRTAMHLLYADKEMALVQYYGLPGYVREKWNARNPTVSLTATPMASSSSSSSKTTSDSPVPPTPNALSSSPTKAKIAFVITASRKEELITRLGYTPDAVKKLTPLQASLILQHDVTPATQATQLPPLERAYEDETAARAAAERARVPDAPAAPSDADTQPSVPLTQPPSELEPSSQATALMSVDDHSTPKYDETQGSLVTNPANVAIQKAAPSSVPTAFTFLSQNELYNPPVHSGGSLLDKRDQSTSSVTASKTWYQVVAVYENDPGSSDRQHDDTASSSEEPVGLYQSFEEAKLGKATFELFSSRRMAERRSNYTTRYEIRTVVK